jgi:predicted DNA-binding transcriptional regulator AlpA
MRHDKQSKQKHRTEPALDQEELTFLSKQEVLARIPITGPTLWNWSRTGKFPKPRFIGSKTVWIESEVMEWMRSRPTRNYKRVEGA